jgi:hypothetical protein
MCLHQNIYLIFRQSHFSQRVRSRYKREPTVKDCIAIRTSIPLLNRGLTLLWSDPTMHLSTTLYLAALQLAIISSVTAIPTSDGPPIVEQQRPMLRPAIIESPALDTTSASRGQVEEETPHPYCMSSFEAHIAAHEFARQATIRDPDLHYGAMWTEDARDYYTRLKWIDKTRCQQAIVNASHSRPKRKPSRTATTC